MVGQKERGSGKSGDGDFYRLNTFVCLSKMCARGTPTLNIGDGAEVKEVEFS